MQKPPCLNGDHSAFNEVVLNDILALNSIIYLHNLLLHTITYLFFKKPALFLGWLNLSSLIKILRPPC